MNEIQQIQVSPKGAELISLVANGREYLWHGDPKFWGRRAPILFPIVGRLADDILRIDGMEYQMKQHGFARDTEFVPLQLNASFNPFEGFKTLPSDGPIFMQMVNDGPLENYPFSFQLKVRYAIFGNTLEVNWEVKNTDEKPMFFQIGAHPAFLLPEYNEEHVVYGYLRCYNSQGKIVLPITTTKLVDGLRHKTAQSILSNKDALIPVTNNLFADDAILLEGCDIACIALVTTKGREALRVSCPQADAFGIWAPNKLGCPFVCIEPWCGVADKEGFKGDISERDFIHQLAPQKVFHFDYLISILG